MSIDTATEDLTVPDRHSARAALGALRRTRQRHRLGDIEWFEVAYRVYLFALVGLIVVVWVSDAVDGWIGDGVDSADLLRRGPAVIGIGVVAAFALGVRSGADGGPVAVELADVRHVLLAPLPRRMVMLRPVSQRLRSVSFAFGLGGAVLGQLIATEVEGSRAAWAAACGVYGVIVGATFVASAVIAHALRVPRAVASVLAGGALAWQAGAAWATWNGDGNVFARLAPGNPAGGLSLWGIEQHPSDLAAVVVVAAMSAAALALAGRLRIESLTRRAALVSQLRFAATMQDLRTVVQLRRQLRAEVLRTRPWARRTSPHPPSAHVVTAPHVSATASGPSPAIVWRRGARSLRRLPLARLTRIVMLAVVGGVAAALTITASPLFGLLVVAALFLCGLESLEPLSQEVDHPSRTDALVVERGWLFLHHLLAPAVMLAVVALVGAAAAIVVAPSLALGALAIAVPVTWAGALGAVVVTIGDAPTTAAGTNLFGQPSQAETGFMPPEFSGFGSVVRMLIPVLISAVGTVPLYAARFGTPGDVARSLIAVALFITGGLWWVRRRDSWSASLRGFMEEGRAART